MTTTYIIGFAVRRDQRTRFLTLLGDVLDAMRHEDMFLNATLHQDPEDEYRFLLYETWADHQDVLDVQLARPYRQAWHEALPELLSEERSISIWKPLRSDLAPGRTIP